MKLYKIPGLNKDFGIAAEEIIRVQAVSNYSFIYYLNGKNVTLAADYALARAFKLSNNLKAMYFLPAQIFDELIV